MSKQFMDKAQSLIHEQSNNCKSLAGSFTHMMKFMGKNPFHLLKDSSTDAFQKIFTPYIVEFKSAFITLMNSISENRSSRDNFKKGRVQLMGDKAVLVYFLSLCPKMNVGGLKPHSRQAKANSL